MKKNNSKVFLVSFIVIALGAVGATTAFFLKSDFLTVKNDTAIVENSIIQNDTVAVQEITEPPETDEVTVPVDTEPEQPDEISYTEIVSDIGTEIYYNASECLLNKSDNSYKKYKISDFATRDDIIDAFVFDVVSEDETSHLGDFKNGFGINVTRACKNENVKDNGWYQPPDEILPVYGPKASVVWQLPDDVKRYVDVKGDLQFGHWWSDVMTVRVNSVMCLKSLSADVRSDGTVSGDLSGELNYNSGNVFSFASSGLLKELEDNSDAKLSSVSLHVSGDDPLGLMKFEFSIKDSGGNDYTYNNLVQKSDSGEAVITWIIPEQMLEKTDGRSIFSFKYNSGNNESIRVNKVDASYFNE